MTIPLPPIRDPWRFDVLGRLVSSPWILWLQKVAYEMRNEGGLMRTPRRLIPGVVLTGTWTVLYTVPSSVLSATGEQVVFCNSDNVPRTVYYAVTPPEKVPTAAQTLFSATPLQENESKVFTLTEVLPTGWSVQAKVGEAGNGNLVSVTLSGTENT